jgi:cytochrome c
MKRLPFSVFVAAALPLLSLALGRVHPFGDPRTATRQPSNALPQHATLPPNARIILLQKCADCHSAQTRWPWYGRLAPASWLMEKDITEARQQWELSQLDSLPPEKLDELKGEIVEQTRTGSMPPLRYRLIHTDSAITDEDVRTLTAWARQDLATSGSVVPAAYAQAPSTAAGPGDAARGKQVFEARCTGCHTLDQNRVGPKLAGVVGRTSGTAEGYTYSDALKKAAITWDAQSLDRWLTDPDSLVPGNNMEFSVRKAQERSDLIAYLQASK